jgi:DNA replication protein DnaC
MRWPSAAGAASNAVLPKPEPPGKTLDTFDFEAVPVVGKAQVMALAAGDAWLDSGANLIRFGPPGTAKSRLPSCVRPLWCGGMTAGPGEP